MDGDAPRRLSPDELIMTVMAAHSAAEIRTAIHLLAVFLEHEHPDEKLRYAVQEMMQRAEALDLRFGRAHGQTNEPSQD